MRKNKRLQELANNSIKQMENDEIFNKLLQEQRLVKEERQSKKPFYMLKQFKAACAVCACVVVSLVVALCVIFIDPQETPDINDNNQNATDNSQQQGTGTSPAPSEPVYAVGNKAITLVSKSKLDEALANTSISVVEENCDVCEATDAPSGDILYYIVTITDEEKNMYDCRIDIITNPYYDFLGIYTNSKQTIAGKEFNVNAKYDYFEEENIYIHTISAETDIDGIKIIVREFTSVTDSEESGFQEFIESILSFS